MMLCLAPTSGLWWNGRTTGSSGSQPTTRTWGRSRPSEIYLPGTRSDILICPSTVTAYIKAFTFLGPQKISLGRVLQKAIHVLGPQKTSLGSVLQKTINLLSLHKSLSRITGCKKTLIGSRLPYRQLGRGVWGVRGSVSVYEWQWGWHE